VCDETIAKGVSIWLFGSQDNLLMATHSQTYVLSTSIQLIVPLQALIVLRSSCQRGFFALLTRLPRMGCPPSYLSKSADILHRAEAHSRGDDIELADAEMSSTGASKRSSR